MDDKASLSYTALTCIFCLCFIIDGLLELKVVDMHGIQVTAGLLVIAFSYIVNDCLVELYGFKKTRFAIYLTFALYACTVGMFQAACWLPASASWEGEQHFQYVFGMAPRITFASMVAFIVGSQTNAWIMASMKQRDGLERFKWRAFVSTVYGELADTATFYPIAFAGVMPVGEMGVLISAQALGKILIEATILPITSRVVRLVRQCEGV